MPDTRLVYVPPVNRVRPGPTATLAPPAIEPVAPGFEPGPISDELPSSLLVGDLRTGFDPQAYRPGTSVDGIRSLAAIDSGIGEIFTAEAVDQPVEIIDQPSPRYPEQLRSLGVAGVVVAQFVVDTLGRVEPESWQVVRGSQTLFEAAARKSLLKARFSPARIRGRAVRQLVQQSVRFSLD